MPKFSSKAKVIPDGNGSVNILFFFPVIITIQGHLFEIYAIRSGIHDNVDLVLRVISFVELEGKISLRELAFIFLNRAVPIFPVLKNRSNPKEEVMLKPLLG